VVAGSFRRLSDHHQQQVNQVMQTTAAFEASFRTLWSRREFVAGLCAATTTTTTNGPVACFDPHCGGDGSGGGPSSWRRLLMLLLLSQPRSWWWQQEKNRHVSSTFNVLRAKIKGTKACRKSPRTMAFRALCLVVFLA
jgi:hypothetical protein